MNLVDAFRGGIVWLNDPLNWTIRCVLTGSATLFSRRAPADAAGSRGDRAVARPHRLGAACSCSSPTHARRAHDRAARPPLTFLASARSLSSSRCGLPIPRCSPTPKPACGSGSETQEPRGGWPLRGQVWSVSSARGASCRRFRTPRPVVATTALASYVNGGGLASHPAGFGLGMAAVRPDRAVGCSSRCWRSRSKASWRLSSGSSRRHRCAG